MTHACLWIKYAFEEIDISKGKRMKKVVENLYVCE